MRKKLTVLILLLLLPTLVSASLIDVIFRKLAPPIGLSPKEIVYLYIIPFVGTFAIVLGLLTKVGIFDKMPKINMILAFLFALSLLYTGTMLKIARFLYGFGAFTATIAFFVLFLIGIWMHGKKKIYGTESKPGWKRQYTDMEGSAKELKKNQKTLEEKGKKLDYVKKRLREINSRIERMAGSPEAKKRLIATKSKLEQEKVDLEDRVTKLKEAVKTIAQNVREAAEEVVDS